MIVGIQLPDGSSNNSNIDEAIIPKIIEKIFLNFIAAGYEAFVLNSNYEWDQVNKLNEHTDYLFVPSLSSTEINVM